MKAVKLDKPWEVVLREIDEPIPGIGEALIKIKAAGICGSDIGAYRGKNNLVSYPRIIGHELAGEVISIPDNANGIKPGDRVVIDPYRYCGECYPCSIGRTNCCSALKVLGVHIDGGMAELFTHPADMLIKLPENIPWELAPLAEPLTIALHGLHRLRLIAGEHIAIFGAGTIGLLASMAALHYQAIPIVIDLVPQRLAIAKELGAKHTINIKEQNLVETISKITQGRMCECVMEASGAQSAIRSSLDIVSYAGRIALTGWPETETSLPTDIITKKEIDIRGARNSAGEFAEALELISSGAVNVKAILTDTVPISDAATALIDIEKHPEKYLKVVAAFK